MKALKNALAFVLFIFLCSAGGCKHGAPTIPELSGKIFSALQKSSDKDFKKCMPSTDDVVNAYNMFYSDVYRDKAEREKEAQGKAVSQKLTLLKDFHDVLTEGRAKNIDWATTKIHDFKYNVKDRKEGFEEANVRMILQSGIDKNVIVFTAMKVEGQWFLVEHLTWEE